MNGTLSDPASFRQGLQSEITRDRTSSVTPLLNLLPSTSKKIYHERAERTPR